MAPNLFVIDVVKTSFDRSEGASMERSEARREAAGGRLARPAVAPAGASVIPVAKETPDHEERWCRGSGRSGSRRSPPRYGVGGAP
jgi:hypothetical protein